MSPSINLFPTDGAPTQDYSAATIQSPSSVANFEYAFKTPQQSGSHSQYGSQRSSPTMSAYEESPNMSSMAPPPLPAQSGSTPVAFPETDAPLCPSYVLCLPLLLPVRRMPILFIVQFGWFPRCESSTRRHSFLDASCLANFPPVCLQRDKCGTSATQAPNATLCKNSQRWASHV